MTQDHQSEPGRGREAGRRDLQRERLIGRVESALIIGLFAVVCGHNYTAKEQYSSSIIIPKGYVQVEGDIITTESNAALLLGNQTGINPNFAYAPSRLWPN